MEKSNKIIAKKKIIQKQLLQETENIAKQLLKDIGMKIHCIGFNYWLAAINTTIDIHIHRRQQPKIMQLYYLIAKRYKTSISNVRKAMTYAYNNLDLNQYFNVTCKINNTALLFLLKEAILQKLKATI